MKLIDRSKILEYSEKELLEAIPLVGLKCCHKMDSNEVNEQTEFIRSENLKDNTLKKACSLLEFLGFYIFRTKTENPKYLAFFKLDICGLVWNILSVDSDGICFMFENCNYAILSEEEFETVDIRDNFKLLDETGSGYYVYKEQ